MSFADLPGVMPTPLRPEFAIHEAGIAECASRRRRARGDSMVGGADLRRARRHASAATTYEWRRLHGRRRGLRDADDAASLGSGHPRDAPFDALGAAGSMHEVPCFGRGNARADSTQHAPGDSTVGGAAFGMHEAARLGRDDRALLIDARAATPREVARPSRCNGASLGLGSPRATR
jgi:hypothetical protein